MAGKFVKMIKKGRIITKVSSAGRKTISKIPRKAKSSSRKILRQLGIRRI